MLPPKTELNTLAEINYSYIIFIWREEERWRHHRHSSFPN
jgi:hypothetical protein